MKSLPRSWQIMLLAACLIQVVKTLTPSCTAPFTQLPYSSGTYCAKCDTTCSTCSGTSINSCSSCPTDFTLETNTSTCIAPSSTTVSTVASLYHAFGFQKETGWTGGDSAAWSSCGTLTVLHGVSNDLISTTATLSPHYKLRVRIAIWWLAGSSSGVTVEIKSSGGASLGSGTGTPTGTGGWISGSSYPYVYCNNSKATNYQLYANDPNSNQNIVVNFQSASASWGIREYVLIQYLCSQPDCATCNSQKSTQCLTCSDTNKKIYTGSYGPCLCKFQNGYYAYPTNNSTYYCVNPCPNFLAGGQYYGDNITKTCVLTCPALSGAPKWGLTFASDQRGICVTECDASITLGGVTFPLYYDLVNKKCTTVCPSTQPYSWSVDRACYATCPLDGVTQYYKLNSQMRCVSVCPNVTQGANIAIPLYIDNTTNTCVQLCDNSKGYWGYINPTTGVMSCILNCPTGFFTDLSSGRPLCTKVCPAPNWYGDFNTLPPSCVQSCTFGTYGDNSADRFCVSKCNNSQYGLRTGTRQCVDQCPSGTWGEPNTMSCATFAYQCMNLTTNPFSASPTYLGYSFSNVVYAFADSANRKCLYANAACTIGQFKLNTTYMCVTSCPSGTYANNITYWCVDQCYGSYFADNTTNQCVMVCPPGYYADKGSKFGNKCVFDCNQTGGFPFRDSNIRQCVSVCSSGAGYADPLAQSCVYNCTPPLYLNNSVSAELTCVTNCAANYFAYNNTDSGICLLTCPEEPPLFGDVVGGVRICVQVCQAGKFGDQTSGSYRWCVSSCPSGTFAQDDSLRRCVTRCNSTTFGRTTDWKCVAALDCPTNYTGDLTTNLCVNWCPEANATFADNISKMCVSKCPLSSGVYYYADIHTRWCIQTCNSLYSQFGNNSTQTCELKCLDRQSFADAQSPRRYCIGLCTWSGVVKYYRNNQTSTCVVSTGCIGNYNASSSIQFTQQYFADNYTLYCVQKCPNVSGVASWGYLPSLTCVSLCYGSTWGDNSTGIPLCVSLCATYPTPLWSYDGPGDKSVMLCVDVCPAPYFGQDYGRTCVQNCPRQNGVHAQTYAYNGTRRCLLMCPNNTWADYITGVCFHYPVNCTAPCAYTNSSCSSYRWADDYNNSCVYLCNASPFNSFGDNVTQKCTGRCSLLSYADNYTGTRICVKRCPGTYTSSGVVNGLYDSYGDNYTQGCVLYCQEPNTYADWQLSLCLSRCMGDDPLMVPTYANIFNRRCVISLFCPVTPDLYFGQNITRTCVPACPLNNSYVSFADNITRACIPQCYYFINATNSLKTRFFGDTSKNRPMCVITCPAVPRLFGENVTNLCVAECPDHQYGDQTGNRSCVPVCPNIGGVTWFSQLTERICVLICEDRTWGNYYNYIGPHCETVGTDCNQTYYGDNSTHMCVPLCPQSMNYFGQPHTRLCTDRCPYLNASTMVLVNSTANINLVEGRLFADYSTRLCVYRCPASVGLQGTFGDNQTNTCVLRCPLNSFGDANTVNRFCVQTCTGGSFADNLTMLCVKVCPASPPTFGYQGNWTCLYTCPANLWADASNRLCVPTCSNNTFRLTTQNRTCVGVCPSTPDLYGDTLTYNCTATCSANQYADPFTRTCTTSCLPRFMYNFRCVQYCPKGYYANSTGQCLISTSCNPGTYGDNSTTKCVSTCPSGSFADNSSRFCIAVCPDGTYGDNLKCVSSCQTNNTIASTITQLCLGICPNYTYSYSGFCFENCSGNTYQNDQTHLCDTSCPTDMYADPTTNRCVTYCPTGYYRQKAGANIGFCVAANSGCNPYFADFISGNCTAKCSTGYWGYTGNYTCNKKCPTGLYGYESSTQRTCYAPLNLPATAPMLFGDSVSGIFVSVCPETPVITYGDRNRQLCVSLCLSYVSTAYYGDPYTRQCESVCKLPSLYTADPATSLCTLKCKYQTFRYNNTPICMTNCPAGYGDFTTRICVDTCSILTQTFGFYNTTSSYRVCLPVCPLTYYSENITRTCTQLCPSGPPQYFAYNKTRTCVTYCNQSYSDLSNSRCMDKCWSNGYPNADNSTNRCVLKCPTNPDYYADSHVCVFYCTTHNFYADPNGRVCTSRCSNWTYNQYADPRTGRCVQNCSEDTWGDNSTNFCVSTCPPGSFAQNTTGKCVAQCPKSQKLYADTLLHVCAPKCSGGYFGSQVNQTCIPICDMGYWGDPTTTLCTPLCPVKIYSFGENLTRTCTPTCVGFVGPSGIQGYADNYSRLCRDKCQNTLPVQTFADPTTKACVEICPQTYFAENTTNTCIQNCPSHTFADNFSQYCVAQCPDTPQSYGDTILNICTYTCLRGQFSDNSTNLCVVQCPGPAPFDYYGDRFTGRCVRWCTQGTYAQNSSRLCVATCASGQYADNLTRRCVTNCPPSQWTFADSTTHRCVRICPAGWYAQNTTQACQQNCWNYSATLYSYADNISNFCVAVCPFGFFGDNFTYTCVQQCSSSRNEYGHYVGRVCVALLNCYPDNSTSKIYYADNTSRTCVQKCPLTLWADKHTFVCVAICNAALPEYRNRHTQTCVWPCPTDPDQFADDANGNCVRTCTTNTYGWTGNRTCQPSCAPFSLYADNTTNRCVSTCATKPYLYGDSLIWKCVFHCSGGYFADNKTQQCVPVCPALWATFGQLVNYTCVSLCPAGTYADALLGRTCRSTCSNSYFADSFTSSCVQHCKEVRPFWYEDTSLGYGMCVSVCPGQSYAYLPDQVCKYKVGVASTCPSNYYADRSSRRCVTFCPNNTYSFITTKYCEPSCSGSYYADPILRKCVTTCSANLYKYTLNATTNLCVQYCPSPMFSLNSSSGVDAQCVATCTGLLALSTTRTCESYCPIPFWGDWSNNLCVTNCTPKYSYHPNRTCLAVCQPPYYGNPLTFTCDLLCPPNYFGHNGSRMCLTGCPAGQFSDPSLYLCVSNCPSSPALYADSLSHMCLTGCSAPYFAFDYTRTCESSCPNITLSGKAYRYLADPFVRKCVLECNNELISFADFTINICTKKCPTGFLANNFTKQCVTSCPKVPNDTFSDNTSRICMDVCLPGSFGNHDTLNCVQKCWWPYYADPTTRTCVKYCPNGYFGDNFTATCNPTCPTNSYADPVTHRCLAQCPALHRYFNYAGNWTCLQSCPPNFYANTQLQACVSICDSSTGMYAYPVTNLCVRQCPIPYRGFAPNYTCVLNCPAQQYFYDVTINVCALCDSKCLICASLSACKECRPGYNLFNGYCNRSCIPTTVITYANAQGICVAKCPGGTYGDNQTYACVTVCPSQQYGEPSTNLCTMCPSTCTVCVNTTYCNACQPSATLAIDNMCYANCNSSFRYSYNGTCYNTCPDGTYLTYTNVICSACAAICLTCTGAPNICTSCKASYYFNSTCLTVCPSGYFGNATTLQCVNCSTVASSVCSSPLSYATTYSVQNYQPVITLQFNQNVSISDQLQNILKIRILARRLLQVGTLVNNGVSYTYQILSNGTIKIYLSVGTSLSNPTFSVDITNPAAVISSQTGLSLQNVQSLLNIPKLDYYPPQVSSQAPTNFTSVFVVVAVLLLYALTFFFSDVMIRPLQILQLLFLHCLISSPVSANIYYLLAGLKTSTLNFIKNWFSSFFPTPSPYYDVPLTIKTTLVDYIFLRNVGQIFVMIVVAICFWFVFLMLGNKRIMKHKIWFGFFSEISQKRFQFMVINDVVSLFYLPITYFGFSQMNHLFDSPGIYSFNGAMALIFVVVAIVVPVVWVVLWCKRTPEQIHNRLWFLTLRIKVPSESVVVHEQKSVERLKQVSQKSDPSVPAAVKNPYQLETIVFYAYMLLCSIWMTGLFNFIVPQLALLITTNVLFLIYLLKTRPYVNKINLVFMILFTLTAITLQAFCIYFYKTDAQTFASQKTKTGYPLVITVSVILVLLLVWSLWRVVWEISFFVSNFKKTQLYLQFADHDYVGQKEASEKYSEYDKLAQKLQAGVGDVVVDKIQQEVKSDGEKVIKVTKKKLVKKAKVKGRKRGQLLPQEEPTQQFIRVNQINIFDFENEPAQPEKVEEPSPLKHDRNIDDDHESQEIQQQERYYHAEEQQKKVDVQPGDMPIQNIDDLSQIDPYNTKEQSQFPFVEVAEAERENFSEQQKKQDEYQSQRDVDMYEAMAQLEQVKPYQPSGSPQIQSQHDEAQKYDQMKSESVIEPIPQGQTVPIVKRQQESGSPKQNVVQSHKQTDIIQLDCDDQQPKQELQPSNKQQKRVVNIQDLLKQQEGKKKNLLFLFDDFDE